MGSTALIGPYGTRLPCIVNQQRDGSQALFGRGYNLWCSPRVGRIGWDSNYLICRGAELCRSFVEFGSRASGNGNTCASGEQRLGKCPT